MLQFARQIPTAPANRRGQRPAPGHRAPILFSAVIGAASLAAVSYLLWPTWQAHAVGDPERTPVTIGDTLFNVPTQSFRVKYQRHSGPQERVDLAFLYPSLAPPERPKHLAMSRDELLARAQPQPIDRIFVSIAAHRGEMSPEALLRTIYPRYLAASSQPADDGLSMRAFADASAYSGEDLFTAQQPALTARCTRDDRTPGMCLTERRIDGADLTYRFPRAWLKQWRDVADAIDRLTAQMHAPRG